MMAVPYMAGTLTGWVKLTNCKIVTRTVTNFQLVRTTTAIKLWINKQPVPAQKVDMKPQEQRAWRWWAIIVRKGPKLAPDDIIEIASISYLIKSVSDWSESGFQKYEVIENYGS